MAERRCLRCGAPYDEGATVCFTCGASIGELETPTQPVRTPKRPAASDVASDVASDATSDAESTPTAQPQEQPLAPVATATHNPSRPLTVGSSFQASAPPAHAPRRIRWPLVIPLVVVVIALLAGGAYALRATLAAPPVPRSVTYHDPQGRFSFAKPALWTVTPQNTGALLADSAGANTLTISVGAAEPGQTASAAADILGAQQGLQSAPPTSIGGAQWEQRAGSVTGSDGATRVVTLYVTIHAGDLYTIATSSPTSVANSINTLVYQPLLASFRFH